MSDAPKTLEEIEQRRAERRVKSLGGRDAQILADLVAIDALEEAAGDTFLTMTCSGFRAGLPVKVAYRAPSAAEYKRYQDQIGRAATKRDAAATTKAQELVAESCWVYPEDKEIRTAFREAFPGTLISMALQVVKLAELRAEDTGKD